MQSYVFEYLLVTEVVEDLDNRGKLVAADPTLADAYSSINVEEDY